MVCPIKIVSCSRRLTIRGLILISSRATSKLMFRRSRFCQPPIQQRLRGQRCIAYCAIVDQDIGTNLLIHSFKVTASARSSGNSAPILL